MTPNESASNLIIQYSRLHKSAPQTHSQSDGIFQVIIKQIITKHIYKASVFHVICKLLLAYYFFVVFYFGITFFSFLV